MTSSMETDADGRPMVVMRLMTAAPAYRLAIRSRISSLFSPRRRMAPTGLCIAA